MKQAIFDYYLHERQIAQVPLTKRTEARLLVLNRATGKTVHSRFDRLHEHLQTGDLLVLNDTMVVKCRLKGQRLPGGGKVELFLLKPLDETVYEAIGRPFGRLCPGTALTFGQGRLLGRVLQREEDKLLVSLSAPGEESLDAVLSRTAQVPLPPYIKRPNGPGPADELFYQTVYCRQPGAVAAPAAGLHFDQDYLEAIQRYGIQMVFITVHTGLGSFAPIRCEDIEDHKMPAEEFSIGEEAAAAINLAKEQKRRVVAVGTSAVRALETAAERDSIVPGRASTDLYIIPGHKFKAVDAIITNLHQPASSLLVLICAFAGREKVLDAYHEAVHAGYRFFSYGDAMLIL